jgi:hypothetical protein
MTEGEAVAKTTFGIDSKAEYRKAGPTDLIELLPASGCNRIYVLKWVLESLVYSIATHDFIHLSGPTGSAKSSLIEAISLEPANFLAVCDAIGFAKKPVELFPVEMATYETPGELYQRRSLKDGTTFDEASDLVEAIGRAGAKAKARYPLIWLREMGRVHSSSVQGGLLNLMTRGAIMLPGGKKVDGGGIAWIADSNYQAARSSTHTLVVLDDALRRRFSTNITLDYLPPDLEAVVIERLVEASGWTGCGEDTIQKVVRLGQLIRAQRGEGALQSVTPPTIYGYLSFIRMSCIMKHLTLQQIALVTMLGNASDDDQKVIPGLFHEVFGLQSDCDEALLTSNLF